MPFSLVFLFLLAQCLLICLIMFYMLLCAGRRPERVLPFWCDRLAVGRSEGRGRRAGMSCAKGGRRWKLNDESTNVNVWKSTRFELP